MTNRQSIAFVGTSSLSSSDAKGKGRQGWCGALSLFSAVSRGAFFFAATALSVAPLSAHDFWIEPSTYRPAAAQKIALQLRVGEHFEGEVLAVRPARIERFFARSASSEVDIGPAGTVTSAESGSTIIAYEGRPGRVELAPAKFEAYLREEGLDSIVALRVARGDSMKPGRELFSRCAKSVIGGDDRPVGLRLEIVRRGSEFVVTFEGEPLQNALVVAMRRGAEQAALRARTDANGVAKFAPLAGGVWLVKTVHMMPWLPTSLDADWESIWASETFEIP